MTNISQDILSQIRNYNDWTKLYDLIQSDPKRFNVHYCLLNCNRNLICGDFMFDLMINGLLNPLEISHHYDVLEYSYIFEIGSRTWCDFMQYLTGTAENDIDFLRYVDAWNAQSDYLIYLENQERQ